MLGWTTPGGFLIGGVFLSSLLLALGGCLIHARVDFPVQSESILLLFLVELAFVFSATRRLA